MAENVLITPGAGDTVAADEILAVKYQRIKLIHGADGVNAGDVSTANPLPVISNAGTGTMTVAFDPGHELGSIKQINSTVGVYVDTITTTVAVKFNSEPTVISSGKQGATTRPLIMNTDGAIKVYDLVQGTVTVTGITNTIGVYLDTWRQTGAVRVGQVDGTVAVYFSQSNPKVNLGVDVVNCAHTASIASAGGSVSGSTSGVSTSGVQIVAPEASRVIKVYAFSITTTAQVHISPRFTNGSGASPVELWRVGLQAPSQGIAGANLAVTPPGYLFATPSGATLCIVNDSASLIHYSIAYFKESA